MAYQGTIDVPTLIDARKVGRFQIRIAALCALIVLLDGFDVQVIGYVAPVIARAWNLQPAALTPVFAAGLVGVMLGALVFGVVADRIGRKAVIVFCTLFFGVGMLLTTTAQSLESLLVWRLLTGFGLGGAMPNAIALTAEYSPRHRRATMVMIMFCGFSLGAAIVGLLAAALIPHYGWTAVFYLGGAVPIILAPLLLSTLPESIRMLALRGGEDRRVAALLSRIDPRLVFDAAARFVIREEKAEGFPVRHLFREGRGVATLLLWAMFFMNLLCLFFLMNWLPTVVSGAGVALQLAVVATALLQVGGVVGTFVLGPLIDRFGPFRVLALTYFMAGVFIPLLGFAGAVVPMIMATAFAAGFCIIGGQNASNALAATVYPTFIRSTGVGWALGIGRIGSIVGPVLGGLMLSLHWPTHTIFLIGALPAFCAAAATFLMGRAMPRAPQAADQTGFTASEAPAGAP